MTLPRPKMLTQLQRTREGQDKSEKEADKGVDGAAAETAAAEGSPVAREKRKEKFKDGDEAPPMVKSEKKKRRRREQVLNWRARRRNRFE